MAKEKRTYKCGYCISGTHMRCVLSITTPSGFYLCSCGFGAVHETAPEPKKIK